MRLITISAQLRTAHRLAEGLPLIASVAVMANGCLLMGKRNDNGLWTVPGGHLDAGELPLAGAIRELREETGLEAPSLELMDYQLIQGRTGREVGVYAYRWDTHLQPTKVSQDPDEECPGWSWIDVSRGLPVEIASNLHSKKNLTLQCIGLQ